MKVLIVTLLCVFIGTVSAGPNLQDIKKIYNMCLETENLTNSQVMDYAKAQKWTKLGCLQTCMLDTLGVITSEDVIDVKAMEDLLWKLKDMLLEICMDCAERAEGDRCSILENFENCVDSKTFGTGIF